MRRLPRLWIGAVAAVVLAVLAVVFHLTMGSYMKAQDRIGGPFELVGTQGETVTQADFAGRYKLVFFGYTYCPDVCPATLLHITRALNILEEKAPGKVERVVPIFISIDPARDTVEQMRAYVGNFHPSVVGLTGSEEQIAAAAKQYKVSYWRVENSGGENGGYTMAHSGNVFIMGPDGAYLDRFDTTVKGAEIATRLDKLIPGGGAGS